MDAGRARTREELARLDRFASEELGLPTIVLMENAGRGAAEHVLALLAERRSRGLRAEHVAILCGPGNNGGDGYVVARHLANAGVAIDLHATHALEESRGDAATMRRAAERLGLVVRGIEEVGACDLAVDALLGTGFQGDVRPRIAAAIEVLLRWRDRAVPIVALDLPSGLDADTGRPGNPCVVADLTVTFAAPKIGFAAQPARACLGRVVVASIGCPPDLIDRPPSGRG